jgi:Phosphotransferase enzyme family
VEQWPFYRPTRPPPQPPQNDTPDRLNKATAILSVNAGSRAKRTWLSASTFFGSVPITLKTVPSVAELIAEHIRRWETSSVEVGVFGTSDAEAVGRELEGFVTAALGSSVRGGLFYGSSAGSVAGIALDDGRRVVIKAYQRQWGRPFLSAVRRVQEHLAQAGFPCPRPIFGPEPAGPALATVEELVPDRGMRTLATDAEMSSSAQGLARQINLCSGVSEPYLRDQHPLRAPTGRLYPQPHNPIFDFSMRADDAHWIDQLAQAAKSARALDDSAPTVAHTDWSARNVRIDDGKVVVAYDWDSLAVVTESTAVGQAAATWRSTGEAADPVAPGPEEIHAYLSAYEVAAGRSFTAEQRRAGMAAALWVLAYTARCEHALEAATGTRRERGRQRLADDGWAFLS